MASAKRKCMAFALLLVVAFLAVPPVAATEGDGYTVRPSGSDDLVTTLRLSDSIGQGETNRHQFYVGSGVAYLEVYLNWGSTSDSLALTIYAPSGSKIGTFHDNADGVVDGKIHIDIDPDSSYVSQGTWAFDVYGEKVSSERSYTFNVYPY
ncbi:MAG: peptidase [Methanoculleus sp.]